MKWVLLFQLFLSISSFAEDLPYCARPLTSDVGISTFQIDSDTQNDLDANRLVAPVIEQHLTTRLGKRRLHYLLQNPFIGTAHIRERQKAVRFLIEHPEIRHKISESLKLLKSREGDLVEDFFGALSQGTKGRIFSYTLSSVAMLGVGWFAVEEILHPSLSLLRGAGIPVAVAIQVNMMKIDRMRSRIRSFRSVVQMAETGADMLADSGLASVQNIRGVLSAVVDRDHPLTIYKLARSLKTMLPKSIDLFGDLLFLTNGPTAGLRRQITDNRNQLEILVDTIGDLDLFVGLAELFDSEKGAYILPEILDEDQPTSVTIEQGHHPHLWQKAKETSQANDISWSLNIDQASSFYLLTGPNTGGKSTFLRMVATLTLMAQIGAPVPARAMRLTPVSLLTNVIVFDKLDEGKSSFFAQAKRVATILLKAKNERHVLIIMDEILTGTSPEEHTAAEQAIIRSLVNGGSISILSTHDRKLQALEKQIPGVVNIHVDDRSQDAFKIKLGPSNYRNAIQVMRDAGIPDDICDDAEAYLRRQGDD